MENKNNSIGKFSRNQAIGLGALIFAVMVYLVSNYSNKSSSSQLATEEIKYNQGVDALNKNDWDNAETFLSDVSKDSPYYQDAQNKIREAERQLTEEKINKVVVEAKKEVELAKRQATEARQEAEESRLMLQQQGAGYPDLSSIIEQWKPLVGYTECGFVSPDGQKYFQAGSGTIMKFSNSPIEVVTNKHVVTDESGLKAYACGFALPDHPSPTYLGGKNNIGMWQEDIADIEIENPDQYIQDTVSSSIKFCRTKPAEGDGVLILGYPAIGSSESITVTQGIISGFEGNFFITDAKIDHGNSGGAAILIKNDCFLGIPTYVKIGEAASLGRILDISVILAK